GRVAIGGSKAGAGTFGARRARAAMAHQPRAEMNAELDAAMRGVTEAFARAKVCDEYAAYLNNVFAILRAEHDSRQQAARCLGLDSFYEFYSRRAVDAEEGRGISLGMQPILPA